jgi:SdrD B-like domain
LTLYKDGVLFWYDTTTSTGSYAFTNLPNGNYNVVLTPSTGSFTNFWALPGSRGGSSDNLLVVSWVVLTGGQQSIANDFLLVTPLNAINGVVYFDAARDSNYTAGDIPQAGQTVTLYKDGVVYGTLVTSSTGSYAFTSLPDGNYSVSYTNTTPYNPVVSNVWTKWWQSLSNQNIANIVLSGWVTSLSNNFGLITAPVSYAGGGGYSYPPVVPTTPAVVVPVVPTPVVPTIPTTPVVVTPTSPVLAPIVPLPPVDEIVPATQVHTLSVPCVIDNARAPTCEMPHTGVDIDWVMNIIYSFLALFVIGSGIYVVRRTLP